LFSGFLPDERQFFVIDICSDHLPGRTHNACHVKGEIAAAAADLETTHSGPDTYAL
jgi:hypothetical protein